MCIRSKVKVNSEINEESQTLAVSICIPFGGLNPSGSLNFPRRITRNKLFFLVFSNYPGRLLERREEGGRDTPLLNAYDRIARFNVVRLMQHCPCKLP